MSYSRRAAIYEIEYQENRDVPFVLSQVSSNVKRVIELPCGSGRMSQHLANRCSELEVIDLEPKMVRRAVTRARAAAPQCSVTGHIQDMRDLSLDSCAEFIVIPREGLQMVPPHDGKKVLTKLAEHIVAGGSMLVDLARFCSNTSQDDPDYYKPEQPNGVMRLDWTRKLPNGEILHRRSRQWDEGDSIVIDLEYLQESEQPYEWSSQMRVYRYSDDWLESSVPSGMHLEKLYGGYDCTSLEETSPRVLARYRKHA